jgi:hypothetical protein
MCREIDGLDDASIVGCTHCGRKFVVFVAAS